MPKFFVPFVKDGKDEEVFVALVANLNMPVPPTGERIYSIRFRHSEIEWTATVGEKLEGVAQTKASRKRNAVAELYPAHDTVAIMAILPGLPGAPCVVITDGAAYSRFESAFFADATSITRF